MTRRDALRSLLGVSVLAFMPNTVKRLAEEDPYVEFGRNVSAAFQRMSDAFYASLNQASLEAALIQLRDKLDGQPIARDIVAVRTEWLGDRPRVTFIDRKDFYREDV